MAAAKKQQYVARYRRAGAEQGLAFSHRRSARDRKLADTVGYRYQYDERTDQFAHGSGIMVLTPDGRISRYLYGIDYHPTDLRLALVESSEGKIGSPVDQFLLLCYHYDPATGKYGFVIHSVLADRRDSDGPTAGRFLVPYVSPRTPSATHHSPLTTHQRRHEHRSAAIPRAGVVRRGGGGCCLLLSAGGERLLQLADRVSDCVSSPSAIAADRRRTARRATPISSPSRPPGSSFHSC